MTIAYTYEVKEITTRMNNDNSQEMVCQVNWLKVGTDENNVRGVYMIVTDFGYDYENSPLTIPYSELTEATVLGWVLPTITTEQGVLMNSIIEDQIIAENTNRRKQGLPWL